MQRPSDPSIVVALQLGQKLGVVTGLIVQGSRTVRLGRRKRLLLRGKMNSTAHDHAQAGHGLCTNFDRNARARPTHSHNILSSGVPSAGPPGEGGLVGAAVARSQGSR